MVHALHEAWRVVRTATNHANPTPPHTRGVLDIRPSTSEPMIYVRLHNGQEVRCGPVTCKDTSVDSHRNADQTTLRALSDGWFTLGAKRHFEWIDEYDTVDDLVTGVEEDWSAREVHQDVVLRLMQVMYDSMPNARALIKQRISVRLLHKALG